MNLIRQSLMRQRIFFMKSPHSTYVPTLKTKYILDKVVREWPDIWGEVLPMAPGEAARTELRRHIGDIGRVGWRGKDVKLFSWRWPMFCIEPFEGYATYIDLKAAYWQIYRKLCLDCIFPNVQGKLSLLPVANALYGWKLARNSVIGVTSNRRALACKDGQTISITTRNRYLSPHLWATIQAILNELAYLALQHKAFYCLSDGWFFPMGEDVDNFCTELQMLGIDYRKVNGFCHVRGWQSYHFEGHKTTEIYKKGLFGGRMFRSIRLQNPWEPMNLTKYWAFVIRERKD